MQKHRAYLSFPISGKDIRLVEKVAAQAKETVLRHFPEYEVVNPLDLCRDVEKELTLSDRQKYAIEMGRDITALLQCDMYVFVMGLGPSSTGCLMEEAVVDRWNYSHIDEQIKKYAVFEESMYEQSKAV